MQKLNEKYFNMIKVEKKGKTDDYVYDISCDGTIVNALGLNVISNTDGFNFKLPSEYRYTDENPYIGKGLNRNVVEGQKYTGFKADVAEFNDLYMRGKMGLGIDEIVDSTINFSRKNYADYFPENPFPNDVKLVGNTIKSKKMPIYISKFLERGIRHLLQNNGRAFLDEYYSYIEKIYNYRIPLLDIASKGKVKKSIKEYIKDCQTLTKAGRPKSRQAWMELAIKEGLDVKQGETIYYVNTGKSKSQADVKKVTKYMAIETTMFGDEEKDVTTVLEKEFKKYKKEVDSNCTMVKFLEEKYPNVRKVEEIILNAKLIPMDIVESEKEIFCSEGEEYNTAKYIDMFNKRITPLLVCFSKDIRNKILITDPQNRPYFTDEEANLTSGEPNKETDQDTYEQLMTMEDKEIRFWKAHPEFEIPFIAECGMNWEKIVKEYDNRIEEERSNGILDARESIKTIISEMSGEEITSLIEDGELPKKMLVLVEIDPKTGNILSKKHEGYVLYTLNELIDMISEYQVENIDN